MYVPIFVSIQYVKKILDICVRTREEAKNYKFKNLPQMTMGNIKKSAKVEKYQLPQHIYLQLFEIRKCCIRFL